MPAGQPSDPFDLRAGGGIVYFTYSDGSRWCMAGGEDQHNDSRLEWLAVWKSIYRSPLGGLDLDYANNPTVTLALGPRTTVLAGSLRGINLDYIMIVRDKAVEAGLLTSTSPALY